jgi:hypothetical protein
MPSKTSTKRKPSGRGVYLSILDSSTLSCESVSHLEGAPFHSKASATLPTTLSYRWRAVIDSAEFTTAYLGLRSLSWGGPASLANRAVVMALLPVASVP